MEIIIFCRRSFFVVSNQYSRRKVARIRDDESEAYMMDVIRLANVDTYLAPNSS